MSDKKTDETDNLPFYLRIIFSLIIFIPIIFLLYDYVETDIEKFFVKVLSIILGLITVLFVAFKLINNKVE